MILAIWSYPNSINGYIFQSLHRKKKLFKVSLPNLHKIQVILYIVVQIYIQSLEICAGINCFNKSMKIRNIYYKQVGVQLLLLHWWRQAFMYVHQVLTSNNFFSKR